MRLGVSSLLHHGRSLLHFLQTDIFGASDVQQHPTGAGDGGFQQRARNSNFCRLLGLILAGGPAYAHMSVARFPHDGGNIRKVQINHTRRSNQIANALGRLQQHVIRHFKGVFQRDFLFADVFQPVVGNCHQSVYLILQFGDTEVGLVDSLFSFKSKGLGHNTHC